MHTKILDHPCPPQGTIDEKIYQRQLFKGEMADRMGQGIGGGGPKASRFTRDELRSLFQLNTGTDCDTRDLLSATSSEAEWQVRRAPRGMVCRVMTEDWDTPLFNMLSALYRHIRAVTPFKLSC